DFVSVVPPCSGAIAGFAASGDAWLVLCLTGSSTDGAYPTALRLSGDHGQSWSDVAWDASLGSPRVAGVAAGPDGAFYLGVVLAASADRDAGRVVRVTAEGTETVLSQDVPVP